MEYNTFVNAIKELGKQFRTDDVGGILEVETPFINHNGDQVTFCIECIDDEISLSDDGQTLNTLSLNGIELEDSKTLFILFKKLIKQYRIEYSDDLDELRLTFTQNKDNFNEYMTKYIQALLSIDTLYYIHKK